MEAEVCSSAEACCSVRDERSLLPCEISALGGGHTFSALPHRAHHLRQRSLHAAHRREHALGIALAQSVLFGQIAICDPPDGSRELARFCPQLNAQPANHPKAREDGAQKCQQTGRQQHIALRCEIYLRRLDQRLLKVVRVTDVRIGRFDQAVQQWHALVLDFCRGLFLPTVQRQRHDVQGHRGVELFDAINLTDELPPFSGHLWRLRLLQQRGQIAGHRLMGLRHAGLDRCNDLGRLHDDKIAGADGTKVHRLTQVVDQGHSFAHPRHILFKSPIGFIERLECQRRHHQDHQGQATKCPRQLGAHRHALHFTSFAVVIGNPLVPSVVERISRQWLVAE